MQTIKVEFKNDIIKIIDCSLDDEDENVLVENKLPKTFKEYLSILSQLNCEGISFKYNRSEQMYRVEIKKTYNEYLFICKQLGEKFGKDTDEIFQNITEKYCTIDELSDLSTQISSEKKMILSIFLKLQNISGELESALKWQSKMEDKIITYQEKMEDRIAKFQDKIDAKLETCYLEKEDLSLLNLLSKMPKIDLFILFLILLIAVIFVDQMDIKGKLKDTLDDKPTELIH